MAESNKDTKVTPSSPSFSTGEEALIKKAVAGYNEQVRKDELDTEIRNRILDEQRKKPGYRYC